MQAVSLTSQKKDYFLTQKNQECEDLTKRRIVNGLLQLEVNDLQGKLKEIEEKMKKEEAKNESEKNEEIEKEKSMSVLNKEKQSLLDDITTSNALIADLNKVNEELKKKVNEMEQETKKQEQTLANMKKSMEMKQEQLDTRDKEYQEQVKVNEALCNEKEELKKAFEEN